MYARDLFVKDSDYVKLFPLNIAPSGRNWRALGEHLLRPQGKQGYTAIELDHFQFQNSQDPVKRLMGDWLPSNIATTAALKSALASIHQDSVLENLGLL